MKKQWILIAAAFMLTYVTADSLNRKPAVSALANGVKTYILGGETVGIKLYSRGLLCVDFADMEGGNPAKDAGLKKGDILLSVNGEEIKDTDGFIRQVGQSDGAVRIVADRDGETVTAEILPQTDEAGRKMIGLWVRDSVAGIGTVTFREKGSGELVTLGHAVTDADTGRSFQVGRGYITDCDIVSVEKSEAGAPGEICGRFRENETVYAYITRNTEHGLFANGSGLSYDGEHVLAAASESEIRSGAALLYTDLAGDGVKPYRVDIRKLYGEKNGDMLVEVTDDELIALTGGIVQGMSGSPIVQDGKLIGALTHVFVNEPTKGYGVYMKSILE